MDITLSAEQKALLKIMEETKQHLFVTGRAGAGKSVLLRHFREQTAKRVVVAAPTGIAALNVQGQTLHSLFKLAPKLHRQGDLAPNARVCSLLKRIDTLIIDEISMVRADLLDAVDERFREAFRNEKPFGGVQVIMFGDVYQLPPVVEEGLVPYFEAVHHGHFFFNALVWRKAEFKVYELSQVFRQKDPIFKDVLNAVRDGSVVDSQIAQLNGRSGIAIPPEGTVTLAPTNALVTNINQERLDQLPGKIREYQATITGEMKRSVFPTEEHLQLKKGAQVVMLKNDKDSRWVNGSVGKVEDLIEDKINVRVGGIVYTLERETWEEIAYTYDHDTQKVEARAASSFTQYPIRLAWALTIHKSQGQTYESVALDLSTATFAAGQLYVALSRATSLEGLYLKVPVKREYVMIEPKVTEFMGRREAIEIVVEEAQTVTAEEAFNHDEIVVNEVQEQTKAVLSDIRIMETLHHDESTIISFPAADHLEIHAGMAATVLEDRETVSQFDSETVKQVHTPETIALLQQYSELLGQDLTGAFVYGTTLRPTSALFRGLEHAVHMRADQSRTGYYTYIAVAQLLEKSIVDHYDLDFVSGAGQMVTDGETVLLSNSVKVVEEPAENIVEALEAGKISRVLAIEVLCPACNSACVDPATGATSITDDLVGHSVVCSVCRKACIVPLNAFSLRGDVVAREKPAGVTNTKREKKGRAQKERKAKSGRKTKGKGVRQPMQLSLDLRVISTLNAMGVNKSELFEELLQQYEPFLDAWSELGNDDFTDEDGE